MKKLLGLLGGLALCVALVTPTVHAQTTQPVIVKSGPLSGANQSIVLNGIGPQSTCSVTTTGTWSGTLSFFVQDPSQLTSAAIKGYAPDGSGTGGTTTTSNISGWTFPCAAQFYFVVKMTSYASGTANVQVSATTGVAFTTLTGGGGGGTVSTVTGTNPIVVTSPSPGTVNVAVSPNPQFSGNVSTTGAFIGGSATAPTCTAGDGCFSRSTSSGQLNLGGSSSSCALDYGVTTANNATINCVLRSLRISTYGTSGVFADARDNTPTSGTYGPAVIAQPTTAPAAQPGNISITGDVTGATIKGKKPSEVSCTDSSVGVISCSATVAYTSTTSYACGMSVTLPTTTTGTATGQYVVNTSATSVTGTVPGLSVATGTATLNFNCLGT